MPSKTPIHDAMQGMTPEERAIYKAERFIERLDHPSISRTYTYTFNGVTITASDPSMFEGRAIQVRIAASDANGPLPLDNPFIFLNPPIMVPDPNGDYVAPGGATYREDVVAALEIMVYEAVIASARGMGWGG